MANNITNQYKSSILGIVLIGFDMYIYRNGTTDYWILGTDLFIGLGLLFSGDKFIEQIESFVFGHPLFKDKDKPKDTDS